eukprot:gnl/Dysnectes_brevis/992_a1105_3756.p1 GENE.gnl/Dysnectes_brevis/992_a1105_3756~~gnl/Dysnectes_brevis/992_a1105_3756.p1  ORF type:complete len:253 (-),score=91.66 gnl/Dysnectes_brevis/992_a1105_3756:97-855(-)
MSGPPPPPKRPSNPYAAPSPAPVHHSAPPPAPVSNSSGGASNEKNWPSFHPLVRVDIKADIPADDHALLTSCLQSIIYRALTYAIKFLIVLLGGSCVSVGFKGVLYTIIFFFLIPAVYFFLVFKALYSAVASNSACRAAIATGIGALFLFFDVCAALGLFSTYGLFFVLGNFKDCTLASIIAIPYTLVEGYLAWISWAVFSRALKAYRGLGGQDAAMADGRGLGGQAAGAALKNPSVRNAAASAVTQSMTQV